ncbi:hypothetical protein K466DRAFT_651823 [Polyporus arcularius HHB13444]|uniref:Uncharacterized protein n=1 Tax=Polyporus arcularius HHB13444 TaxID=1314778 RepID=A0A5C3PKU9_9APHY|nr:hypothetical protein K466DRAFT_651823 [Polyporus arcularius HHB13444]
MSLERPTMSCDLSEERYRDDDALDTWITASVVPEALGSDAPPVDSELHPFVSASHEPMHAFVGPSPVYHPHSEMQAFDYITSNGSSGVDFMQLCAGPFSPTYHTPSITTMDVPTGNAFDMIDELSPNDTAYIPHRLNGATNILPSSFPSNNVQSISVGSSRASSMPTGWPIGTNRPPPFVYPCGLMSADYSGGTHYLPATRTYQPALHSPTIIPSPQCLPTNISDRRVSSMSPRELPRAGMHSQHDRRHISVRRGTAQNLYGVVGPQRPSSLVPRRHQVVLQSSQISPPHGDETRPPTHARPFLPIDPSLVHATSTRLIRQPPAPSPEGSTDSGVAFSTTTERFGSGAVPVELDELLQATYSRGNRKPNLDGIPDSILYGPGCRLDRLLQEDFSGVPNAADVPFPAGVLPTKPSYRFCFRGYRDYGRQVSVKTERSRLSAPPDKARLALLAAREMEHFLKRCATYGTPFDYGTQELYLMRIDFVAKGSLQARFGVQKR